MKRQSVAEIREIFLNYFQDKSHKVIPSSSLLPAGDPTLLFTTAGMVQFKPFFTGAVELPYTRATSCQKCLRTTDLEVVGKTERHCTFFEMLGNFSFGDYFKEEAIEYALDCSVNQLGFDKDKIWVTVYTDDDEAERIWTSKGIPKERITRLGKKDNFWGPAGDSGACGPCSELYLDRGIEKGGPDCATSGTCKPGCDCDRFLEFWNIVFNQFNQDTEGNLHPLKQTGIDTGSGLERVALLLQGVDSVYDTDELRKIISFYEELSGLEYITNSSDVPGQKNDTKRILESRKTAFRVVTDHIRSVLFSIGDGIYPDRTGRGYVIRRLIRRATLFGRKLNFREPFLYKLVDKVVEIYKPRYPELGKNASAIAKTILAEEELFLKTLELGLEKIEFLVQKTKSADKTVFSGADAFLLYGTYGFPAEMTEEIVTEQGLDFDKEGFQEELEKDRQVSRESWKANKISLMTGQETGKTEFLGYSSVLGKGNITHLFRSLSQGSDSPSQKDQKSQDSETGSYDYKPSSVLKEGQAGAIVLGKTAFYPEGGGQVGDTGFLRQGKNVFKVSDTQKENDVILHFGEVLSGEFSVGQELEAEVESSRRERLRLHHSGTHLLNGALRTLLGDHVLQKGSVVSPEYLRFDFSHPSALTSEEIRKIESWVNESIRKNFRVETKELPIEDAKKTGAVATFGEKYGDQVRVVRMGDASVEFCGGTHVSHTGEIGYFFIKKESSPGAGNRRIEGVCGPAVIETFQNRFAELTESVQNLNLKIKSELGGEGAKILITTNVPGPDEIREKLEKEGAAAVAFFRDLSERIAFEIEGNTSSFLKTKRNLESRDFENNVSVIEKVLSSSIETGVGRIVSAIFEDKDPNSLKGLSDNLKVREKNLLVILGSRNADSASVVITCSSELVSKGIHCGNLVKAACEILGGKGGGKPDMAQGGGKEKQNLESAISSAIRLAKQTLTGEKV
ncbi:alanine--tRNA ligase [Leptospira santarosai]|uniref:alanine--tRNA ligase n=1 Tax=Leptospira santarosai TaxID=28183 RepID=UPI0002BE0FBF|nr:alanine--tRNA ligase [Leptospira santarosai]EMJ47438.1 alanine--tRNA ligase [Leptospira santarosai str. HAI1349]EMP82497.1 alanine--tRNA ligase [Leptospira santarosai str. CBC1531]MDI7156712.1 alanine--tRNA ligase [Leptospira santarosai]MDI7183142.1 alanine--tRNA ligase [Leptospira santarosai]